MNALFLLYAMTVSLELVLSLLMAMFLYLIVAPRSRHAVPASRTAAAPDITTSRTASSSSVSSDPTVIAIRQALETISRGENDVQTLIQTRRALQVAEREVRGMTPV